MQGRHLVEFDPLTREIGSWWQRGREVEAGASGESCAELETPGYPDPDVHGALTDSTL